MLASFLFLWAGRELIRPGLFIFWAKSKLTKLVSSLLGQNWKVENGFFHLFSDFGEIGDGLVSETLLWRRFPVREVFGETPFGENWLRKRI